eukprot:comp8882_c0_seq1/m.4074 comp8882_c0_seq1/g.4074  ORF comp8882_c0_seq1/g.4074 comp8882_c0_seq1/m.4074 type:complete len:161 (-) comp8882_c0_seq1:74-556(-)
MGRTNGYRAGTRHMFSRRFRHHGPEHLSTYLITYKVGDIVDVRANGSIHKGMPHKFYHGKTGIVFNVTPHAVGVVVNKRVGNRIIKKRVNLRVEHIQHSTCRDEFLNRVKKNEEIKKAAKAKGETAHTKRVPRQPRTSHTVTTAHNAPERITPVPYGGLA